VIECAFYFNPTRKNTKKVDFFSNFSKLERFLWKLSPIEEYNRNLVRNIDVKRHPIRIEKHLAHLELVNPMRRAPRTAPRAKATPPRGYWYPWKPNTSLSPQAPDLPSFTNLLAMFSGKLAHTVYNAIECAFCFNPTRKNSEKMSVFQIVQNWHIFLWKLSPIEEYNHNPVHGINIKRHPIRIDRQPPNLELVNPMRRAQHLAQKPHRLVVTGIRGNPIPAFRY
jgi:hypothetical protein